MRKSRHLRRSFGVDQYDRSDFDRGSALDVVEMEEGLPRRKRRRRHRKKRRRAPPKVEYDDAEPRSRKRNSSSDSSAMICICAIGTVLLLLLGLGAAWAGGLFSPTQPNQHQYQRPPPQPQTQPVSGATQTKPAESEGTGDAPPPDTEGDAPPPDTDDKPQITDPCSDKAKLKKYHNEVLSPKIIEGGKTRRLNYGELKPILNWIRLQSKWALTFQNNTSWWRMKNNTRWFCVTSLRTSQKKLNERSIQAMARTISRRAYDSHLQSYPRKARENIDRVLWLSGGFHEWELIRDIFHEGKRLARKWRKAWNETNRQNWTQFASYFHNTEELVLALNDKLSEVHKEDATPTAPFKKLGPERVTWYVTHAGDYVFKEGTFIHLPKKVRLRLRAEGFKPGLNSGMCTKSNGTFMQYLKNLRTSIKDRERLYFWGNMEWAKLGCSVIFGVGCSIVMYTVGITSGDLLSMCRSFFIPFSTAMVFSFWEQIRIFFYD